MAYPNWICWDCGQRLAPKFTRHAHLATWHEPDSTDPDDKCGFCGTTEEALTEPRDFGHPEYNKHRSKKN